MRNLTLLLDFDEQYRRDQQQDRRFLHRRDRCLCSEQAIDGSRGSLAAWLHAVHGHDVDPAHIGERLRVWRWMRVLFVVLGLVLGAATMLGLLYYDGGRQINVTLIIGVALLQLLLALFTTAQAWSGWQPWRGVFRSLATRWMPNHAQPHPLLRTLAAPLAARIAQTGGLAFAIAALVVLLSQVVIHDLAFGWSTTLQASAPAYHELTRALAWPWRSWLPGAVPSLTLVEQSRYFRVGPELAANPELLGSWWRFLTMLWLFYVVLPRIVLLALARVQLAWRVRHQLAVHPGRAALRERCTTPWIDTGDGVGTGTLPPADGRTLAPAPATPGRVLIRWADAGESGLARQWLGADGLALEAGGSASLEEDGKALEQARAIGGPVIILARGWEPPTGELADFITQARTRLAHAPIQLLPLAAGTPPALPDARALAPWLRFIQHLDEANAVVVDVPATGVAP
ncbi:MAG: DUF2868 domain-containing protein [Rhodanobacter sp.]